MKAAQVDSLAALPGGAVLVAVINFLVIAFVVFLLVRAIESMKRSEAPEAGPDPQAQLAAAANRLAEALEQHRL